MLVKPPPLIVFSVILAASAVITASAEFSGLAALDVRKVMSGQLWRLFTGHLAHITWRQYQTDAAVFLLVFSAYARTEGLAASLSLILFSALGVSLAVLIAGNYQIYAGLSGLGCAGFSANVASQVASRPMRPLPWLLGLLFMGFLAVGEGMSDSGVEIASEAHIAGAACGVLFTCARRLKTKPSKAA